MSLLGWLLLSLCLFAFFWGTNCSERCFGHCRVCTSDSNTPGTWDVNITNGTLTIHPTLQFACEDAGDCCWAGNGIAVSGGSLCTFSTVHVELCIFFLTPSSPTPSIRMEVRVYDTANVATQTLLLLFGQTFPGSTINCQTTRTPPLVSRCDPPMFPWTCTADPSAPDTFLQPCCPVDCACPIHGTEPVCCTEPLPDEYEAQFNCTDLADDDCNNCAALGTDIFTLQPGTPVGFETARWSYEDLAFCDSDCCGHPTTFVLQLLLTLKEGNGKCYWEFTATWFWDQYEDCPGGCQGGVFGQFHFTYKQYGVSTFEDPTCQSFPGFEATAGQIWPRNGICFGSCPTVQFDAVP